MRLNRFSIPISLAAITFILNSAEPAFGSSKFKSCLDACCGVFVTVENSIQQMLAKFNDAYDGFHLKRTKDSAQKIIRWSDDRKSEYLIVNLKEIPRSLLPLHPKELIQLSQLIRNISLADWMIRHPTKDHKLYRAVFFHELSTIMTDVVDMLLDNPVEEKKKALLRLKSEIISAVERLFRVETGLLADLSMNAIYSGLSIIVKASDEILDESALQSVAQLSQGLLRSQFWLLIQSQPRPLLLRALKKLIDQTLRADIQPEFAQALQDVSVDLQSALTEDSKKLPELEEFGNIVEVTVRMKLILLNSEEQTAYGQNAQEELELVQLQRQRRR